MTSPTSGEHEPPAKTATPKEQQAVVVKYLSDTRALVNHGLSTITRQRENLGPKADAAAIALVDDAKMRLTNQLSTLGTRIEGLGGSTAQPLKDAVTSVTGFAAGVYNAIRPAEAARSVRDDYTFLSHLGVSYLMLHTTATSLDDPATGAVAAAGYKEVSRMVMAVDRLLPGIVLQALRDDGLHPKDTSGETAKMVTDAWK